MQTLRFRKRSPELWTCSLDTLSFEISGHGYARREVHVQALWGGVPVLDQFCPTARAAKRWAQRVLPLLEAFRKVMPLPSDWLDCPAACDKAWAQGRNIFRGELLNCWMGPAWKMPVVVNRRLVLIELKLDSMRTVESDIIVRECEVIGTKSRRALDMRNGTLMLQRSSFYADEPEYGEAAKPNPHYGSSLEEVLGDDGLLSEAEKQILTKRLRTNPCRVTIGASSAPP